MVLRQNYESLFKKTQPQHYNESTCVNNVHEGRKKPKKNKPKITKDVRNHSRLKNENEAIKDRINTEIKNLFEQEDYYKPVRVGNNNQVEYESNV